jgi:hypothetical protein
MRLVCGVIAAVLVASCGGDSPAPIPTGPPPVITPPSTPAPPAPTPAPTFVVSGTVRDDRGAPVAGAQVYGGALYSKTGPGFSTTTTAAGAYSGSLPAGTWQLSVSRPGFDTYISNSFQVVASTTVDVTLKPGVLVHGRVAEQDVGPLAGARIEVLSGPNAGQSTVTGPPGVPGSYGLNVLPGEFRIRASKEGYEPVERLVTAFANTTVDFTLKWAYGSCLRSVAPVLFDRYRSAGGEEIVAVDVNAGKTWTATPDQPWITVTSPSQQTASGRVAFRILPHPRGAVEPRKGAIMIRCSASEGQNVWVVQNPDCQVDLTPHPDTPSMFPAAGGIGRLRVRTGTPGCRWRSEGAVDWIRSTGVSDWPGDFDSVAFVVSENHTGAMRTGSFVVGETVWTVTQR